MFSFRKKEPDAWKLEFGWSHEGEAEPQRTELAWSGGDSEAGVLTALQDALASPALVHEHVRAQLHPPGSGGSGGALLGVVAAAGFGSSAVRLALSVQATRASLTEVVLARTSGGGALPTSLALALWTALEVEGITRLRVADAGAIAALADARVLSRFTSLRVLNLSNAGLAAVPGCIGLLRELQELRVVGNQLRILPPDIGKLTKLRVLAADSNQLTILPGELRQCVLLEELTLQHNRLTSVLLSFASLRKLSVLHLYDNPLEFLPEISPCASLTHLTVANLRVTSDAAHSSFKVEVLPPPPGASSSSIASISLWDSKQSDKLRPIFALMLRRSSGHHPLLAGALRVLAEEDPKNRELMARQENGLQQLVLMALSDNPVVVEETCRTLTLLAEHSPALADAVVENDAGAIMRLLPQVDEPRQLSSLRLLAAIAYSSTAAAERLATEPLLVSLQGLVGGPRGQAADSGSAGRGSSSNGSRAASAAAPARQPGEAVRTAALKALGNLAFCAGNQRRLSRNPQLMGQLSALALDGSEPLRVQVAALRVLAILGENDLVWRASRRPPIRGRGVRILSMDGGGMKGMATVRLLRELERHTGRRIHELFDLIVGTSTGGLLAVALGLRQMSLDECEHIYKVLGRRVFSRIVAQKDSKEESWMESFYRTFRDKTSHVRAVVVGYKHDAATYESLLREYCDFSSQQRCIGDSMIDTAGLGTPAVALVSTLASVSPAPPYVFRTYQHPPDSQPLADQIGAHAGSCKHPVWQAVRASSAASFYLEDFSCCGDKFQDGAVTANNPAMIALQEARLLWPDHAVDVMVSLGVGLAPAAKRDKGLSSFMETGAILIESSTDVLRVEEALSTLLPLVPGVKYFRFRASDPRCAMELDEIDPERWASLEAATDDYIAAPATQALFAEAAAALAQARDARALPPVAALKLGRKRRLAVLRCAYLGSHQQPSVDDAVAAAVALLPACAAEVNLQRLAGGGGAEEGEEQPSSPPARQPAAAAAAASAPASQAEEGGPAQAAAPSEQAQQASGSGVPGEDASGEQGGLSAYLSSWFASPTKPAKALGPAPVLAGAGEPTAFLAFGTRGGSSGATALMERPAVQQEAGSHSPRRPPQPAVAAAAAVSRDLHARSEGSAAAALPAEEPRVAQLLAQLEEQLAPVLPTLGAVHLGLPHAPEGAVVGWRQRLRVVAEPSMEAGALLREAAQHSSSSAGGSTPRLVDLFSRQTSLPLSGARTLTALSSQTQWVEGAPLSTLLLSDTSPGLLLPAVAVGALGWLVRDRFVTSTAALSPSFVAELLGAGARGVVCASPSATAAVQQAGGPQDHGAFFTAFYDNMLGGGSGEDALQAAKQQVSTLAGAYSLHSLPPG